MQAPRINYVRLPDGYRCGVRVWDVDNPIAYAVMVHGIISHSGWYTASCSHLASSGVEVHYLDRRGSGLNTQARGDVDHFETWLRDVEGYLADLPDRVPRVLCGVSWGGKLVAALAKRRPELIDGLALLCPGLFARQFPSAMKYRLINSAVALGLGSLRATIPLQDPALFTDTPKWQEFIKNDPLTLRQVTLRFAMADRKLTRIAIEAPEKIRVPTLLMLAEQDRIVDNARVSSFFERIDTSQKQRIEYPAAHTLEFEPDPQRYLEDLSAWVGAVVKQ